MKSLDVVHIGGLANRDGAFAAPRAYANLYNDLMEKVPVVRIFSGYHLEGDSSFDFLNEVPLNIHASNLCLFRNNNHRTGSLGFLRNYARAFRKLLGFVSRASQLYVIMPSAIGIASVVICLILRKRFALYIAGNWSTESQYRTRGIMIRWLLYPINRYGVDRFVNFCAKRAMFVITPAYDRLDLLRAMNVNVHAAIPLISAEEHFLTDRTDTCRSSIVKILYVGELRRQKGIVVLLDAFTILVRKRTGLRFTLSIVGSGEMQTELMDQVRARNLQDLVDFRGHVPNGPELFQFYRWSDIFAFPSLSEGFPRVLYEAALFRIPIVCTSVGGIPYFFKHKEHCLLVPAGSATALSQAIEVVARDDALRAAMIEKAFAHVRNTIALRRKQFGSSAGQIVALMRETLQDEAT